MNAYTCLNISIVSTCMKSGQFSKYWQLSERLKTTAFPYYFMRYYLTCISRSSVTPFLFLVKALKTSYAVCIYEVISLWKKSFQIWLKFQGQGERRDFAIHVHCYHGVFQLDAQILFPGGFIFCESSLFCYIEGSLRGHKDNVYIKKEIEWCCPTILNKQFYLTCTLCIYKVLSVCMYQVSLNSCFLTNDVWTCGILVLFTCPAFVYKSAFSTIGRFLLSLNAVLQLNLLQLLTV